MGNETQEIKDQLNEALAKVDKVRQDVRGLHEKIDALGDAPTPEQLAEIKSLSSNLNAQLAQVDEMTDDAPEVQP